MLNIKNKKNIIWDEGREYITETVARTLAGFLFLKETLASFHVQWDPPQYFDTNLMLRIKA